MNRASNWLRPTGGRALPRWRRRGMVIALAAPLVAIVTACASTNTPAGDVALSTPLSSASAASASSSPSAEASPSPSVVAVVITSAPAAVHSTQAASAKSSTCGAPNNPYGYNFCGRGGYVTSPSADICSYFDCIANFFNGHGYMVECNDGTYSMSGGISGACSYHGGEDRAVYSSSASVVSAPSRPAVVHTSAPPPVHTTAAAPAKPSTCGAPSNPYGYNFCGRGGYVTSPPAEICSYFNCIANFFNGHGYMVECNDGTYSMSGGIRGACSYHKGEDRAVDGG